MNDPVTRPRSGKTIRSSKIANRRSELRDRLLAEAARMFAEQGIDNVSVEELIEAVGISRATFYGFFANKTELAANILLPVFATGIKKLSARLPKDPLELAAVLVDLYLELWSQYDHALLLTARVDSSLFPYIATPHNDFGAAMLKVLKKIAKAGLLRNNDAELTYLVLAKTGIPLLVLYNQHPEFEKLYRESLTALLLVPQANH